MVFRAFNVAVISIVCRSQLSKVFLVCLLVLGQFSISFSATSTPSAVEFAAIQSNGFGGSNPSQLVLADFDNDGLPDLAVLNSSTITILLSAGDGTYPNVQTIDLPANLTPISIAAADINGGDIDLIVSLQDQVNMIPASQVNVYSGQGDGSFQEIAVLTTVNYPGGVTAADFDGNGIADIAVTNSSSAMNASFSMITLFSSIQNNPGGGDPGGGDPGAGAANVTFNSTQIMANGNTDVLRSVDMNGDKKIDLVTNSEVYINNGNGGFSAQNELDSNGLFAIGRLNQDVFPDVIQLKNNRNSASEIIVQMTNQNGSLQKVQTLIDNNANFSAIDIADLNHDGLGDIIAIDRSNTSVNIYLQNCTGLFSTQAITLPGNGAVSAIASDFLNNDNEADIVAIFHNNGGNNTTASVWLQIAPQVQTGAVQFCQSVIAYNEGVGKVEVEINRVNGSNGAISINYTAAGFGTSPAVPDVDFKDMSGGSVMFLDGDITPKRLRFDIIDDILFEADETFIVTINSDIGGLGVSESYISILNNDVNQPPQVDTGGNQTVTAGDTVILDGSASFDPDGGMITSHQWLQLTPNGNPVTFTPALANVDIVSFVAPSVTGITVLTFELSVVDYDMGSAAATMTVTINPGVANVSPVAVAGLDRTVAAGDQVVLDGSGSSDSAGGSIVTYTWTQAASDSPQVSLIVDPSNPISGVTFIAPELTITTDLNFLLTVEDDQAALATAPLVITVQAVPVIPPVASAGADQNVIEGSTVVLNGGLSSTGANISYLWTSMSHPGLIIQSSTSIDAASFIAPTAMMTAEIINMTLTVTDSNTSVSATDMVSVTVFPQNNNLPPISNAGGNQDVFEGARVSLDGSLSSDGDGAVVAFLWEQLSGPVVTLSTPSSSVTEFTAASVLVDTTLVFRLEVTDDKGAKASSTVEVIIKAANNLPEAVAGDAQTVPALSAVDLDASASFDSDGNIVSYLWQQISGTMVVLMGSDSVLASFTAPDVTQTEILRFELTVTDNEAGLKTATVEITVMPVVDNTPPVENPTVPDNNAASEKSGFGAFDPILLLIAGLAGFRRLGRRY